MADCNHGDDGEPYMTLEGLSTQDSVLKDLELHISMAHPRSVSGKNSDRTVSDSLDNRPDRFPRPVISELASRY